MRETKSFCGDDFKNNKEYFFSIHNIVFLLHSQNKAIFAR